MKKIIPFVTLSALFSVLCLPAYGQQPEKIPVVGILLPETATEYASYSEAFEAGLRELGYLVGKNIRLEHRYTGAKLERRWELAAELVRLKVDVIVVVGGTLAAAKRATSTIPIVAGTAGDLVGAGYVASLARPGGNVTGSTNVDSDFSAKRLEILKEAFPTVTRVSLLALEGNRGDQDEIEETQVFAERLGVQIQVLALKDPSEFRSAFAAIANKQSEALIITNNSFNFRHRKTYLEYALKNRLPTMCGRTPFVDDGCLISYAASRIHSMHRAAVYVDKILKGAKPADLPVEQPTKFEFVINLKTAKQIGVTIPQSVLYRADRVIK